MTATDFLGKTVLVPVPARDNWGKLSGETVVVRGTCTHIGPNEYLGWPLQITIGRAPFEIKDVSQIQIIP